MICEVSVLFSSASTVLSPLPVIARTVGSSGPMCPLSISFFAAASVTPTSGFREDPFCGSEELNRVHDFNIGGVLADTAGVSDCVNGIDTVCRIPNSEGFRDCVRSNRFHKITILFVCIDDGSTSLGLGDMDFSIRFIY